MQSARSGIPAGRLSTERSVPQDLGNVAGQDGAERLHRGVPRSIGAVEGQVGPSSVRVAVVEAERRTGQDRVHRGRGEAEQTAIAERLAHPADRGAPRLHRPEIGHVAVGLEHLRGDLGFHGGEESDAGGSHCSAHLDGSEHGDAGLLVDDLLLVGKIKVVVSGRAAPDAARIEDLVCVAPVGSVDVHPQRGLEQIEPFEEEGPLLRKKGLEGREVEDALVRLHLAEVRIDGPHQGEVARHVVAEVEPSAEAALPLRIEGHRGAASQVGARLGIGRDVAQQLQPHVRPQLQLAHRMDAFDPVQQAEAAHVAGPPVGAEAPLVLLLAAGEDPVDVEAHQPGPLGNAHHPQRDLHLHRPAFRSARDGRFPGGVPVGGEVDVVEVQRIELLARGVDLEVVGGSAVEGRVQVELHRVALDEAVAAAERGGGTFGIVAVRAEVQVLVVPEHTKFRAHARGLALVRAGLPEAVLEGRGLPRLLVHPPVDLDGSAVSPRRVRDTHQVRFRRELLARLREYRRCRSEQQQGRAHSSAHNGGPTRTFQQRIRPVLSHASWYLWRGGRAGFTCASGGAGDADAAAVPRGQGAGARRAALLPLGGLLPALLRGRSYRCAEGRAGVALLDASTGELRALPEGSVEEALDELARVGPREVLVSDEQISAAARQASGAVRAETRSFRDAEGAEQFLKRHLGVATLDGFGLRDPLSIEAAAEALAYLQETQRSAAKHVVRVAVEHPARQLWIDPGAVQNLELFRGPDGRRSGTLLSVVDGTLTASGGRLLSRWLAAPLIDLTAIRTPQDAVEELSQAAVLREEIAERLRGVLDVERLLGRLAVGQGTPRDLAGLRASLREMPALAGRLEQCSASLLRDLGPPLRAPAALAELLQRALIDEVPAGREPGFVRPGFRPDLDELTELAQGGRAAIAAMETAEKQRTGIQSLKVRYNKIFGFYIEITKANLHLVPQDYQRKSSTVGAERFATAALSDHEARVLSAEERRGALEQQIFDELRQAVLAQSAGLRACAEAAAQADVLLSLAKVAADP